MNIKIAENSKMNSEKCADPIVKKSKDEWPDYLNRTILNVINEKLKFTKMTPVQVA